jgi:hypothetical protein
MTEWRSKEGEEMAEITFILKRGATLESLKKAVGPFGKWTNIKLSVCVCVFFFFLGDEDRDQEQKRGEKKKEGE